MKNHPDDYSMVTYKAKNVLSDQGYVKRGVCIFKDGVVDEIIESKVKREENGDIIS